MFKNITVQGRLILLSVVALFALIVVGAVGFYATNLLRTALDQAIVGLSAAKNQGEADMMHDALRGDVLLALRGAQRNDAETLKTATEDVKKHADNFNKQINANKELSLGAATKDLINKADADVLRYEREAAKVVELAKTDPAAAEAEAPLFFQLFSKLEDSLDKVSDQIEKDAAATVADTNQKADFAITLIVGAALAALALIGLIAYLTYQVIANSLRNLQSTVVKVNQGDLEARVSLKSNDELGQLGQSLNKLLDEKVTSLGKAEKENEQLNDSVIQLLQTVATLSQRDLTAKAPVTQDVIGTVSDSINQLTDATSDVLRGVTRIAGVVENASLRVKQQSDNVSDVAKRERVTVQSLVTNLNAATDSMADVAKLAGDSNIAAAEATRSTETAMNNVQATVRGMDSIRETISEMEKRIKRLGERSQEISQIVGLINTISERTHVLSLNASMQAAMAGDAGRGFAVVAEEVQRLAESSRQSTAQIANLVQNIQIETNDTIATVNKTIDQVVRESEQARASGERMRETKEATARLVGLVASIAAGTATQLKLSDALRVGAGEITTSTEQTATQLQAQGQVTAGLVSAAQKLVESVSVFTLPKVEA